jgi:transposase, IS5 family
VRTLAGEPLPSVLLKAEHRMDRNYLKGRDGDRINAVLAAASYNLYGAVRSQ